MRSVILFVTTFLCATVSARARDSELSVCDLVQPAKLSPREVLLKGRMLFTMHGAFLTTDPCPDHSFDIVILYPGIEGTPSVPFGLEPGTLDSLKPFFRPNGGTATACGLIKGQVFFKKGFHSKALGAGSQGNGFGARGAFPVAFVLRGVAEIRDCK